MSRPEKNIDWDRVDEMLQAGCIGTEIAAVYDMHPNTFYDRVVQKFNISFTEYSTKKRSIGDKILREAQFNKAIGKKKKGDNTLLIFLGKQRLNQRDNPSEQSFSEETVKPLLAVMAQLASLQSQEALKMEDNKDKTADKSA